MNNSPALLDALRREIEAVPTAELPSIVGGLVTLHAEAWVRIMSVAPAQRGDEGESNDLLTTREAAERLNLSERFVRNHGDELGRVRLGRAVRYPLRRVESYILRKTERPETLRNRNS